MPVTGDVADTETEPLFERVAMVESENEELDVAEPDASRVLDTDEQPVDDRVTPPADLVGAAREGDGLIVFVMAIVFVPVPRPLRDDDTVPVRRVDFDSVGVGLNVILTTEPVAEALPPVGELVDCDVPRDETVAFKVIRPWPDGDPVGMTDSVPELRGDDEELGVTLIDAVCDALPELDGVADEVGVSCGVAEDEGETNPDAVIEGETLLEPEPLEVLLPDREPDADAEPLTVLEMTDVCVSVFVAMYVDTAISEREGEPDSLMVFVAVRDLDVVDVIESVTEPTTVAVRALSDCVAVTVCVPSGDVVGLAVCVLRAEFDDDVVSEYVGEIRGVVERREETVIFDVSEPERESNGVTVDDTHFVIVGEEEGDFVTTVADEVPDFREERVKEVEDVLEPVGEFETVDVKLVSDEDVFEMIGVFDAEGDPLADEVAELLCDDEKETLGDSDSDAVAGFENPVTVAVPIIVSESVSVAGRKRVSVAMADVDSRAEPDALAEEDGEKERLLVNDSRGDVEMLLEPEGVTVTKLLRLGDDVEDGDLELDAEPVVVAEALDVFVVVDDGVHVVDCFGLAEDEEETLVDLLTDTEAVHVVVFFGVALEEEDTDGDLVTIAVGEAELDADGDLEP